MPFSFAKMRKHVDLKFKLAQTRYERNIYNSYIFFEKKRNTQTFIEICIHIIVSIIDITLKIKEKSCNKYQNRC